MKTLIKYPLSLFILILIGYSQLFAPLYRGIVPAAPSKKVVATEKNQKAINVETSDVQTVFIAEEEEEEENRVKHPDFTAVDLFIHASVHVLPLNRDNFSDHRSLSGLSYLGAPYILCQVFRL